MNIGLRELRKYGLKNNYLQNYSKWRNHKVQMVNLVPISSDIYDLKENLKWETLKGKS